MLKIDPQALGQVAAHWRGVATFGLQGAEIVRQQLVILLLAVPILIQVYFNAGLAFPG